MDPPFDGTYVVSVKEGMLFSHLCMCNAWMGITLLVRSRAAHRYGNNCMGLFRGESLAMAGGGICRRRYQGELSIW
jgi:hypothetical protein